MTRSGAPVASGGVRRWPDEDPAWLAASDVSDYLAHLSAHELADLSEELHDVICRHRDAAETRTDAEERRQVRVIVNAFPLES